MGLDRIMETIIMMSTHHPNEQSEGGEAGCTLLVALDLAIIHKFLTSGNSSNWKHSVFRFVRWWSARLNCFLKEVEPNTLFGFVLDQCNVVQEIWVPNVRRRGITMLVYQPLELCCIRVPGANVLGLQVLELAVDVVSRVTHGNRRAERDW
eukprot:m.438531 g.438531  ORF g.438531 m.438531 type:complete len:151 (-) comp18253_c0_seq1:36-488(-)